MRTVSLHIVPAMLVGVPGAVTADTAESLAPSFEHIWLEDGLSQSHVTSMWQDRSGYMWFATEDGLNRYDGKDFLAFHRERHDILTRHRCGRRSA